MNNSPTTYRRRGGILLIAGATLTIAGALLSAVIQGSSSVPDSLVRYPFSHDAFPPFTVFAAVCHLLMLIGAVYLARGGLAGDTKTGRIGLGGVIAGLALLFVCEWAQLPFADQHTSNTGPSIVDGGFGLATLLLAGGMIAVGVANLRQPSLDSWRRYAPLDLRAAVPDRDPDPVQLGPVARDHRALRWLLSPRRRNDQRRRPPPQTRPSRLPEALTQRPAADVRGRSATSDKRNIPVKHPSDIEHWVNDGHPGGPDAWLLGRGLERKSADRGDRLTKGTGPSWPSTD